MIGSTTLKVCGITRAEDARVAAELGADFLGFILYPKSPRYLSLAEFEKLSPELPAGPTRVAVMVEPSLAELSGARDSGFERFQIHARADVPVETVRGWSELVGAASLWLAPKLPPGTPFPEAWLSLADTFLVDTYHADGFGGSGKTGDWSGFAARAAGHSGKTWILAGGLAPENIAAAVASSAARFVDVNSGVEEAPGRKDHAKLRALAGALSAVR